MKTLPHAFVQTCRQHPRRFAMSDATSGKINFSAALVKTVFLARRLKKIWAGQSMVGIYLPPSVPGALVNHAAFLCGKVPVNLNYTLTETTLAACAKQCEIKTVITSRKFLGKIKLTPPGELFFLEDIAATPMVLQKITAFLLAKFAPVRLLERAASDSGGNEARESSGATSAARRGEPQPGRLRSPSKLDSLATVIFSSGSTGEPKGVMLSHYNILSNIQQMEHILNFTHHDRFLGILPFFHSFGFTVTLCLPAVLGIGVVFHPNPLDAKAIGTLVRENAVTLLLATPTFLQLYLRGVAPADFGSLQLVITGAEKLPERLAAAFEEHFGIRPMEGYGTTECGPAVSVNLGDFRAAGFHQAGGRRGKIGRPLPGMQVRIANADDPWNGESF